MDKQQLNSYRVRLLQAGIPYRMVKRNVRELQDHFEDLQRQGLMQGQSVHDAAVYAQQQMGDLQVLAERMLSSTEKSLLHRYPRLMTIALPPVAYVLLCLVAGLAFMLAVAIAGIGPTLNEGFIPVPLWVNELFSGMKILLLLGTPLMLLYLVHVCVSSFLSPKYWSVGVLLLALLGSGLDFNVSWPEPAKGIDDGSFYVSVGYASQLSLTPTPQQKNTMILLGNLLVCGVYARYLLRKQSLGAVV